MRRDTCMFVYMYMQFAFMECTVYFYFVFQRKVVKFKFFEQITETKYCISPTPPRFTTMKVFFILINGGWIQYALDLWP